MLVYIHILPRMELIESVANFSHIWEVFLKLKCFHFLSVAFRFCAILSVVETRLVRVSEVYFPEKRKHSLHILDNCTAIKGNCVGGLCIISVIRGFQWLIPLILGLCHVCVLCVGHTTVLGSVGGVSGFRGSVLATLHWRNLPSGASLRALPDISRSPTSHT